MASFLDKLKKGMNIQKMPEIAELKEEEPNEEETEEEIEKEIEEEEKEEEIKEPEKIEIPKAK